MENVEKEGALSLKASRTVILMSGVVSLVVSLAMISLAILAILAYNCEFYPAMRQTRLSYMMFLLYFRTTDCQRFIYWNDLGTMAWWHEQPVVPDITAAVLRTFTLACLYLAVNVLVMIVSVLLLLSLKREGKNRFATYGYFVAPFLFVSFLAIVLDIVAISLYTIDNVNHATPMGIMQSLEIIEPQFERAFADISAITRSFPSFIMLAAASKMFVVFILNIAIFGAVIISGWKVAKGIETHQNLRTIDFNGVANSNSNFGYANVIPPQVSDSIDGQPNVKS